jgi:DNA-binding MarR family transcriptional regulator
MDTNSHHQKLIDSPCTWFNVRRASRAVTQFFDHALQSSGLKVSQGNILGHLSVQGDVAIGDLADDLIMDRTTLTRNVQVLAKHGYITVTPGKDRRTRMLSITEKGEVAVQNGLPLWKEANQYFIKGVGHNKWNELVGYLAEIATLARKG